MGSRSAAIVSPRLLTRQQAAAYCGVSIGVFATACPVRSIELGPGRRLERFDVQALDEWIDRLRGGVRPTAQNWLDRI